MLAHARSCWLQDSCAGVGGYQGWHGLCWGLRLCLLRRSAKLSLHQRTPHASVLARKAQRRVCAPAVLTAHDCVLHDAVLHQTEPDCCLWMCLVLFLQSCKTMPQHPPWLRSSLWLLQRCLLDPAGNEVCKPLERSVRHGQPDLVATNVPADGTWYSSTVQQYLQ